MPSDDQFEIRNEDGVDASTRQLASLFSGVPTDEPPILLRSGDSVGRYVVRKQIGAGGFGVVFLSEDSALKRDVCIKVSRTKQTENKNNQFSLIKEAQAAASLDHPNVVRVFDTGLWNDYPYLVMEYVSGSTLGQEIRSANPISVLRALMLMKQVAFALTHLHSRGLIHRDLKPANILIGPDDAVKLTDFGLAISDEMPIWNKQQIAGTQRYMAPEQVLGETHRIDGRTDIWGFGVVLYELLTSKPPFRATDPKVLFQSILKGDAPSLRQRRPDIPHALDQFCLRCLSHCMTDRYQSTTELLEDLEMVLSGLDESHSIEHRSSTNNKSLKATLATNENDIDRQESESDNAIGFTKKQSGANSTDARSGNSNFSHGDIKIVPRGLRSFDEEDHAFFLKLIPGLRGARDVPVSLQFWQNWIAGKEGSVDGSVGVLYGPSGAGKSSFVKAGLLPSIRTTTHAVYLDFTVESPIQSLLLKLYQEFPETRGHKDLATALATIRNQYRSRNVLLVIDQFEQYLANTPLDLQHELVQALRQCDGVRLKTMLMVRDEFWHSISQFMHLMESSLADQRNALSLPLLNQRHAERILEAIGRAYENLPPIPTQISDTQQFFIQQAIQLLSQDGRVICVRLSMFAELMRNHPWDPKTLVQLGGIDGVAFQYLEESFDVPTAPISHRSVAEICREILRSLLPLQVVDIKSSAKTKADLQLLVHHVDSPFAFEQAMRVLEVELKIISTVGQDSRATPLYSLTHDYLVKPVKDWIDQHDQSSWQGRARRKLQDLAVRYEREPSHRNLPSAIEWCMIQASVGKTKRTQAEQNVIAIAGRAALSKLASVIAVAVVLIGITWFGLNARNAAYQEELSKASTAVELFLNSKSSGLQSATKNLLGFEGRAEQEYKRKKYINDSEYDNRLTLLGLVLGADVDFARVINAIDAADLDTQATIQNAFSNPILRNNLFRLILKDTKIPERLHWFFVANNDFRLLTALENSVEPSPSVLCHQIAACSMDLHREGDWDSRQLEEWVAKKQMDSEVHLLLTLLEGLVGRPSSDGLSLIERQATSNNAEIAMTAQWFIEKSKNEEVDFRPVDPRQANWRIENPDTDIHLPMIRVAPGAMTFSTEAPNDSSNQQDSVVGIVIENDIWVTQDKISVQVAKRFAAQESRHVEVFEQNGFACFSETADVYHFCNWLSKISNYEPAYEFPEKGETDNGTTVVNVNVVWKKESNGFRLLTEDEHTYIATCGDTEGVLVGVYNHEKMFKEARTRSLDRPKKESRLPFLSLPNPMGFQNVLSAPAELLLKNSSNQLGANFLDNQPRSSILALRITQKDFLKQTGLRLVRGAKE